MERLTKKTTRTRIQYFKYIHIFGACVESILSCSKKNKKNKKNERYTFGPIFDDLALHDVPLHSSSLDHLAPHEVHEEKVHLLPKSRTEDTVPLREEKTK